MKEELAQQKEEEINYVKGFTFEPIHPYNRHMGTYQARRVAESETDIIPVSDTVSVTIIRYEDGGYFYIIRVNNQKVHQTAFHVEHMEKLKTLLTNG